jgi:dihydroorotate dehydrogenase (NAD+) catalytic subunit
MAKNDLFLKMPWVNAAGSLGFAPDPRAPVDLARLGAFITNPVSLNPRTPSHGARLLRFPGGFLLHTGLPNPGLRQVIRRYARAWGRAPLPVWVHLLAEGPGALAEMVARLEGVEGVTAIELGIPPDASKQLLSDLLDAATSELPLVVRLPLDRAAELIPLVAARLGAAATQGPSARDNQAVEPVGTIAVTRSVTDPALILGAAAISLGPPHGVLPEPNGRFISGRLYGPAVYPLALQAVRAIARFGIPVLGAGGVYSLAQAESMLQVGATGVQLDATLWQPAAWFSAPERL